jgi:hypothetical protein
MPTFNVIVTYEMDIEADDEGQARRLIDGALKYYINNPVTGELINADIEVYEEL